MTRRAASSCGQKGTPSSPAPVEGLSVDTTLISMLDTSDMRIAFVAGVVGFQDAAVPDGDLLPQHVAEGVDDAAFGLCRHVARPLREAGIEIKVVSTDNPPTILRPAPGRTACPRRLGEPAFQRSNSMIRKHARRMMCRSATDVLSRP